jgi:hypothetical protein
MLKPFYRCLLNQFINHTVYYFGRPIDIGIDTGIGIGIDPDTDIDTNNKVECKEYK